ncbi:MAG: hydrogenase 3 maturation endopeptidase HyCI [Anaerolineales bacterium]
MAVEPSREVEKPKAPLRVPLDQSTKAIERVVAGETRRSCLFASFHKGMTGTGILEALRNRLEARKAVILGVGNPLRGDDGFGPSLVKRLQGNVRATVINAEEVPENYLGTVVAADPQVVMIVDAVELGLQPGDVAIVEADDLGGTALSTHSASLSLSARFIQSETHAEVFLLGVQPLATVVGATLSPPVEAAIDLLQRLLQQLLPSNPSSDLEDSGRENHPGASRSEPQDAC